MQDNNMTSKIEQGIEKMGIRNKMFFRPIGSHELYDKKIRPHLQKMSEGIEDAQSLVVLLREFKILQAAKRSKAETEWNNYPEEFTYTEIIRLIKSEKLTYEVLPLFSKMANFILSQQEHFETRKIQILEQRSNDSITLAKDEVIYILCLMALNLVPLQDYDYDDNNLDRRRQFPKWNDFSHIFSTSHYKTNTVLAYFHHHFSNNLTYTNQTFIIRRSCLELSLDHYLLSHHMQKMTEPVIKPNHASIEEFTGLAKVDFANKFIGGGALHDGCVQEEIMFANHPQLFISGIFCQIMLVNESIYLQGFRKYSKNEGYGFKVEYAGQQEIIQQTFKTPEYIIAIDAYHFQNKQRKFQFKDKYLSRELLKAYAGFSNLPDNVDVATGNWGCGVFNGDIGTKFLIQWLACSMTERKMIYCPYGSRETLENNWKIIQKLKQKTVADVHSLLIRAGQKMEDPRWNIFRLIQQTMEDDQKPKPKI